MLYVDKHVLPMLSREKHRNVIIYRCHPYCVAILLSPQNVYMTTQTQNNRNIIDTKYDHDRREIYYCSLFLPYYKFRSKRMDHKLTLKCGIFNRIVEGG